MTSKPLLGELLLQQNLVTEDVIKTALRVQVGGNRRIGHILVRMKAITADQLAEVLQKQLGSPLIDIAEKFSPEVKSILPRYLCKQYDVLPLCLKQNNILEMVMANPADPEAINNLEQYTGKVIEPLLGRHSDIEKEICRRIPFSIKDLFTPQTNSWTTRIAAISSLLLVLALGFFTFDYVETSRYGEKSTSDTHVLYKHHDLILGIDLTGKYSLLGHGAFSKGYYSASFDNAKNLKTFVENRATDFSEQQKTWLMWAIEQAVSEKFATAN